MDDNHIIRVIIQGYDRLSGVLQNAARNAGPSLDGLRDKFNQNKQASDAASKANETFIASVDAGETKLNRARAKIGELNDSLRVLAGQQRKVTETAEQMFDRLSKQGDSPRASGRFISKEAFVEAENARRKEVQLIDEQNSAVAKLSKAYKELRLDQRLIIPDDIVRGFKAGIEASEIAKEEITRRLRDNRNSIAIETREISLARAEAISELESQRALERQELSKGLQDARKASDEKIANYTKEKQALIDLEKQKLRDLELDKTARIEAKKAEIEIANLKTIEEIRSRTTGGGKKRAEERLAAKEELILARASQRIQIQEALDAIEKEFETKKRETAKFEATAKASIAKLEAEEKAAIARIASERRTKFDAETDHEVQQIRRSFEERRRAIPEPLSEADVLTAIRGERASRVEEETGAVERSARRVGLAFGDLRRGFDGGRRGLSQFLGAAGAAQSVMARFGATIGRATSDVSQFVNIRWLFIVGIISTLLTLLVQLGAALVAIAASAVTAGAALGGALAAGAAQALPVVGLLAAAFSRLEAAMKVVDLREKERDQSAEDALTASKARQSAADSLADSQYSLARAIESVGDAEKGIRDAHERVKEAIDGQKDAVKDLATARQEAARAIVDASLEERDARLSLEEAELSVLEAKQRLRDFENRERRGQQDIAQARAEVKEAEDRLRAVRSQGDAAEVATATSALAVARSNLSAIQDQISSVREDQSELETSLKRAQLNEEQARVRRQRAIQENRQRRRQGVEGSPEVQAANERLQNSVKVLRDAIEDVSLAERRRADALHAVVIGHRNVDRAQKDVKESLDDVSAAQRNVNTEWGKLSEAEREFVLAAERLQDKWEKVSRPITDIIIKAVTEGLEGATVLLDDPEIQSAFKGLAEVIAEIGEAFTTWVVSPEGRRTIEFFVNEARKNLPIVAEAAGDLALALISIAKTAAPIFADLIELIGDLSDDFKGVTDDQERMDKFFSTAGEHLDAWIDLAGAIGRLFVALTGSSASSGLEMIEDITDELNEWADWIRDNPDKVADFFDRIHDSLKEILPVVARFIQDLISALTSEEFSSFARFVLRVMIPAMLEVVTVLGLIASGLEKIIEMPIIGPLVELAVKWLIVFAAMKRLIPLIAPIVGLLSLRRFLIVAALIILIEHWEKLEAVMKRVKEIFDDLPEPLQILAGALGGAAGVTGLAGALLLLNGRFKGLITHSDTFIKKVPGLRGVLVGRTGLVAAFGRLGLAGAVIGAGIVVSDFIRKIPGWDKTFRKFGESLYDSFYGHEADPQKLATEALEGEDFAGKAVREMFDKASRGDRVAQRFVRSIDETTRKQLRIRGYDSGGIIDGNDGKAVPAIVHAGEWVLNRMQQQKLAARMRTTVREASMFLFGTSGMSPTGTDPNGKNYKGSNFEIATEKDEYGEEVSFVKMRDGRWGQVSDRAAKKIIETDGAWIPGYVRRSETLANPRFNQMLKNSYASGGIISFAGPALQSFASGGIVRPPSGITRAERVRNFEQNFNVKTEGTTDWNHVMKLGAISATEGY